MTTHLIIPDQHAHPEHDNNRADWLGCLIAEVKPEVVINLGDACDFPSLCSYDKGKRSFQNKSYVNDIQSHLDFQDRLWARSRRQKQKRPTTYFFEGNHEERVRRAIDLHPELDGAISYDHLELDRYYHNVVYYDGGTPGVQIIDGVAYAHYFISGAMGKPIGGEHHAYTLMQKHYTSSTCGHSHLLDWSVRTRNDGLKMMGMVAGCYIDKPHAYAGVMNYQWWSGVVIKQNVEGGRYDPQFISLASLRKEYGS